MAFSRLDRLGDGEIAIGTVRNHRLTRLRMKLRTVERDRDEIWLERNEIRYAARLGIGLGIAKAMRPCNSLHGRAGPCAATPRAAQAARLPAPHTSKWARDRHAGWYGPSVPGRSRDIRFRKVSDRIAAGLEEEEGVLALGNPEAAEASAHAPLQWLDIEQPLRQGFRGRGIGQRLPARADLAAKKCHLSLPTSDF